MLYTRFATRAKSGGAPQGGGRRLARLFFSGFSAEPEFGAEVMDGKLYQTTLLKSHQSREGFAHKIFNRGLRAQNLQSVLRVW